MSRKGTLPQQKNGGAHNYTHEHTLTGNIVHLPSLLDPKSPYEVPQSVEQEIATLQDGGSDGDIGLEDFIVFDSDPVTEDVASSFATSVDDGIGGASEWLMSTSSMGTICTGSFPVSSCNSLPICATGMDGSDNVVNRELGELFGLESSSENTVVSFAESVSVSSCGMVMDGGRLQMCQQPGSPRAGSKSSPGSPTNFLSCTPVVLSSRTRSYSDSRDNLSLQDRACLEELERGSQLTPEEKEMFENSQKELQALAYSDMVNDKGESLINQDLEDLPVSVHGLDFDTEGVVRSIKSEAEYQPNVAQTVIDTSNYKLLDCLSHVPTSLAETPVSPPAILNQSQIHIINIPTSDNTQMMQKIKQESNTSTLIFNDVYKSGRTAITTSRSSTAPKLCKSAIVAPKVIRSHKKIKMSNNVQSAVNQTVSLVPFHNVPSVTSIQNPASTTSTISRVPPIGKKTSKVMKVLNPVKKNTAVNFANSFLSNPNQSTILPVTPAANRPVIRVTSTTGKKSGPKPPNMPAVTVTRKVAGTFAQMPQQQIQVPVQIPASLPMNTITPASTILSKPDNPTITQIVVSTSQGPQIFQINTADLMACLPKNAQEQTELGTRQPVPMQTPGVQPAVSQSLNLQHLSAPAPEPPTPAPISTSLTSAVDSFDGQAATSSLGGEVQMTQSMVDSIQVAVPVVRIENGCLVIPVMSAEQAEPATATSTPAAVPDESAAAEQHESMLMSVTNDVEQSMPETTSPKAQVKRLKRKGAAGGKQWMCGICFMSFPKQNTLKIHIMKHTGERPFKCSDPDCHWAFRTAYKLRRHEESHEGKKDYVCDIEECGKKFTTVYNLNTHRKLHERPCVEVCMEPGCNETFPTKRLLDKHVRLHGPGEKTYKCPHPGCDKFFFSRYCIGSHMRVHQRDFDLTCPFENCRKTFQRQCRLKQHMRSHTGERPYVCPVEECNWSFSTSSKLRRHYQKHNGVRKYVCPIEDCDKSFLRSEHLKGHLVSHSEEKPFACTVPECTARFKAKSSLYVHMKKHSKGMKPFTKIEYYCPLDGCESQFSSRLKFRAHIEQHYQRQLQNALDMIPLLNADDLDSIIMPAPGQGDTEPAGPAVTSADSLLTPGGTGMLLNTADFLAASSLGSSDVDGDAVNVVGSDIVAQSLLEISAISTESILAAPQSSIAAVPPAFPLEPSKSVFRKDKSRGMGSARTDFHQLLTNRSKKHKQTAKPTATSGAMLPSSMEEADAGLCGVSLDHHDVSDSPAGELLPSHAITFRDPDTGAVYLQTQLLQDDPPHPDLYSNGSMLADPTATDPHDCLGADLGVLLPDHQTQPSDLCDPGSEFSSSTINLQDLDLVNSIKVEDLGVPN